MNFVCKFVKYYSVCFAFNAKLGISRVVILSICDIIDELSKGRFLQMSKLSFILAALLVAGNVNAQGEETGAAGAGSGASAAGAGVGTIGGIATGTIVAGAIAAGVLAAVVSNNRSDTPPEEVIKTPKCTGTDPLVKGLCVGTRQGTKVTVTGSGTGTATRTTTISVPVTFTYAPTLG